MKDDEVIKIILDLKVDNIKQERELFKHVAILSSAIVGVFLFNGNYELGQLATYGVIGLFLVIVLSVFLLYIILRIEREQAEKARIQIMNIKEIKDNSIKEALASLFNKNTLEAIQGFISKKDLVKTSVELTPVALNAYNKLKEGDKKILEEKNRHKGSKGLNTLFSILSSVSIILFICSLIFIILDTFSWK